jgi:hypothetical protein
MNILLSILGAISVLSVLLFSFILLCIGVVLFIEQIFGIDK